MSDFSKFRTAVSGFNRTDVVNYIESTSIEHQKALRKLTDERDKLAAENARLQVELAGLQKRLEQAQADNDALSGQVNALAQEGSDLAEQLKKAEEAQQEQIALALHLGILSMAIWMLVLPAVLRRRSVRSVWLDLRT